MTPDDHKDLMGRAADASIYYPEYRYKVWGYGEWIAIEGLLSAARICGKARYLGFVEGLVRGWISRRDQLVPADHLAPGVALTELYKLTGQEEFMDRAIAVARLILTAPRSSRGARLCRPDVDRRAWVDCIYSDPPLFTRLGLLTGDAAWFSEAVAYTLELWDLLADSELPLLYHGYDDDTQSHLGLLWGRGVGWALLGMVDTLADLPARVAGREALLANMSGLVDTLRALQAPDGNWHTVLNEPTSCLESSIAAFAFVSLHKAMRVGLLDESFAEAARKSWSALMKAVRPDGTIPVSEATAPGDLKYYNSLRTSVYPWGQGPLLRALEEHTMSRATGSHRIEPK